MKRGTLVPSLVVVATTIALLLMAATLLPAAPHWVGHDYSYFLPYLVSGTAWIRHNGWLSPPYFTPDFCGGIPWLGNPQSLVYSLPQWLALHMGPVTAARWTLVLSATGGGAATWLLLRRRFAVSVQAATLGGVLFQLNSLLLLRLAVGHLTFHTIAVIPALALVVLAPADRTFVRRCAVIAGSGLLVALAIFGGAMNLIVPIFLGVALIVALAQRNTGLESTPWLRLLGAAAWSVPLSAIKLVPAMILASRYPRGAAPALFGSVLGYIELVVRGLFVPASVPSSTAIGASRLSLGQYELDFGVSIVPVLLVVAAIAVRTRTRRESLRRGPLLVAAIIVAIVVAATFGSRAWAAVLHQVPVINNNSVLTRWWLVFTFGAIVLAALAFDRLAESNRARGILLLLAAAILVGQTLLRDYSRYTSPVAYPFYDPALAVAASGAARNGVQPAIDRIERPDATRESRGIPLWGSNDGVFAGASDVPCYEPLFDRQLAAFNGTKLEPGPITSINAAGEFDLADPRCYVATGAASCSPGTPFAVRDSLEVRRFVAHEPLGAVPWWQRVAAWATATALAATLLCVAFSVLVRRRVRTAP